MAKRVKIDWVELVGAFDDGSPECRYYLDTDTGEVLLLADFLEPEDREQVIDAIDRDTEDRYREIPRPESRQGYQDMEDFIETVGDAHFREMLVVAIQGRGAFRRFKDVLARRPAERERWFAFQQERTKGRIREWLEDEDLEEE